MFVEYVARSGEILAREEAEINEEADLATLVGSLSERFEVLHPSPTFRADLDQADCMIRIGAVTRSTAGAFA
jgi:hypothetical protein